MFQLGIQIGAVQQQVGTVQGQAVVDVERYPDVEPAKIIVRRLGVNLSCAVTAGSAN